MPASLAGVHAVEESARLLRHYRYASERSMRILGGWIALSPELSAKLLLGRHVWDIAQHCDAIGQRLLELRSQAHVSAPAGPGIVAFMDELEAPEAPGQTVERLVGMYRVLKPHLLATYEAHLAAANPVYEPPTRRLLARCIEDERRHIGAGETILRHLTVAPVLRERAAARQAGLESQLAAVGGVTGRGLPAATPSAFAPDPEAQEFIRLERSPRRGHMPEGLAAAVEELGHAIVSAEDADVIARLGASASALVGMRYRSWELAALARLGHQYLVKLRLGGPSGSAVLLTRWQLAGSGWRAVAAEVVRVEPA